MESILYLISFFWFARTIKFVFFWIYLWQLKDYHVGRFLDHFNTHKGRQLLLNPLLLTKLVLLLLFSLFYIFYEVLFYILLVAYLAETVLFILGIARRSVRLPKFTAKATLLTLVSFVVMAEIFIALSWRSGLSFTIGLLLFDICLPLVVTAVVLLIQPIFVIARNMILARAKKKIATFKNLTVIAITGSYGKTSTKEFLTTMLASRFNVLSTPEHKNSEIGIAQTILQKLDQDHEIFIVEMGAYNKGGIKLLCDMVKPSIGLVVGVNEQHLSTFGSLENLLSAEGGLELVEALPDGGLIVLNGDNSYCLDLYKKIYKLRGAGLRKKVYTLELQKIDSDIWTEDIVVQKNHITFIARTREKEITQFDVRVLGRQHVQNLLGAILVARELKMSMEQIHDAADRIVQHQAGMTLATGIHGINIIDSSYSSNPDGVIADIDYLNVFNNNPLADIDVKKAIVMPCLIELGNRSEAIHKQLGAKIAVVCDLAIITTRDQYEALRQGALENGMSSDAILLCENPAEILAHITTFCKEDDAVLLEGRVPAELIRLLHNE